MTKWFVLSLIEINKGHNFTQVSDILPYEGLLILLIKL